MARSVERGELLATQEPGWDWAVAVVRTPLPWTSNPWQWMMATAVSETRPFNDGMVDGDSSCELLFRTKK